jgi:alkyl hydroperoxide reductase subunit AhpC/predicted Ser/Thr protein kinase
LVSEPYEYFGPMPDTLTVAEPPVPRPDVVGIATLIGNPAPSFDLPCTRFPDPARSRVSLADYGGRWLVLVFYPSDFSLICPTELIGLSQRFDEFAAQNCELLGISCDSVESHERWIATPRSRGGLGGLSFPLGSDLDGLAARAYGVFQEKDHLAVRGLFIIDPEGLVQYQVVHSLSVGRRSQEVLRVLAALQTGGLCREDWMADGQTIDPFQVIRPGSYFSHYQIEAEAGSGTFAKVYRARDLQLDRSVALKVFKPDCPVTPSAALAEARVAAALNHPNLCTIYAVDDSAGVPIISMEYIAGESLSKAVGPGQLPNDSLLSIARQIVAGMAAAHAEGIVHGDLKPENVMVTAEGLVKVLDFGLARRLRRGRPVRTDETAELGLAEAGDGLFGTPRYLSPEQVRGGPATQASDIFSLGILFYELSTGKVAFPADNLLQVLDQIRSVDPDVMAAQAPEPFDSLLRRMLSGNPAERLITMREVADALLAHGEPPLGITPIELFPTAV